MGGRALIILRKGDRKDFWGLVTVTIDFDNLIEMLGLDNLEGIGVNYALSYIDTDGHNHIMHEKSALGSHTEKTQFSVRNLTRELDVSPKMGWIPGFQHAFSTVIILLISGFVVLFTDIHLKLRKNNIMLLHLSNTDQLTGGLNRMSYGTALSELSSMPLHDDFVYVSSDLNGLKQINDTLGHLAGDELIGGASKCLCQILREYGKVYRIGGDEFAALIRAEMTSLDTIMGRLNKLTKDWKGKAAKELSLSVGYASHREFPDASLKELSKTADKRMYDAKRVHYNSKAFNRRKSNE